MVSSRSKIRRKEAKRTDDDGCVRSIRSINRNVSQVIHDEQDLLCGINGWEANRDEQVVISSINSDKFKLTSDELCKNWGIGKALAERTLEATTQLRVRTVANPSVERRWPTGDRPL